MKFLVDLCAGRGLAEWLGDSGYDALEARLLGPDPGDRALLERAEAESRILGSVDILVRLFRCQQELKACRPVRDVSRLNVEIDKTN